MISGFRMMLLKCLLLALQIACIAAVTFECSFFEVPVVYLDTVYTCLATVSYEDESPQSLTVVGGDHAEGKFNEDVRFLRIYLQDLPVLPKDIEKFFPFLEGLMISTSNLLEIKADDLRPFPQLKILFLNYNLLKSLDGDLFSHSPNLVSVEFRYNEIEHIGSGFLKKLHELKNLQEINFSGNLCIDIYASTPAEISELLGGIQELCPPLDDTTPTEPTTTTTEEITTTETTTDEIASPAPTTENAQEECTCTPRISRPMRRKKRYTLSVVRPV